MIRRKIGDGSSLVMVPKLYRAILQLGKVKVTRRGEENVYGPTIFINGRERRTIFHWGETYWANCPFCRDQGFQLSINYEYGQLDSIGLPKTDFAKCSNQDCIADPATHRSLAEILLTSAETARRDVYVIERPPWQPRPAQVEPVPAGGCLPLSRLPENHPAVRYLTAERQFPRQLFDCYGLSYCVEASPQWPLAAHRIIVPIWFKRVYAGWQARYVGEPPQNVPKYVPFPGMHRSLLLYNFDRAVQQPFVIVVRSVTDVWRIGDCAAAILGRTVKILQSRILAENWADKPIVLLCQPSPGSDWFEEQSSILRALGHRSHVVLARLPDGCDPAMYGPDKIKEFIRVDAAKAGVALPL